MDTEWALLGPFRIKGWAHPLSPFPSSVCPSLVSLSLPVIRMPIPCLLPIISMPIPCLLLPPHHQYAHPLSPPPHHQHAHPLSPPPSPSSVCPSLVSPSLPIISMPIPCLPLPSHHQYAHHTEGPSPPPQTGRWPMFMQGLAALMESIGRNSSLIWELMRNISF